MMKKAIVAIVIIILAGLGYCLVKNKQVAYEEAKFDSLIETKFNATDTNGDGLVSKEEYDAENKQILSENQDPEKIKARIEQRKYTWKNADINHDNALTKQEFQEQMHRYHVANKK